MIVIGIDPHKKSHTAAALEAPGGQPVGTLTVATGIKGLERLLVWARDLKEERVFAVEDCRHVSGRLERFLIAHGERVVRVPPKLMAGTRRSARSFGKSDPIDARAAALAAVREPDLPKAHLAGPERDVKLLLDHREDLVEERIRIQQRLRWHLHDLDPELCIPAGALDREVWLKRIEERLVDEPGLQARIASDLVQRCRQLSSEVRSLEGEIRRRVKELAPELLALPGCGALTAAKLLGETAGVSRFSDEAKFALHAGVAPLEASSGERRRHRLNRKGNRQLNVALHRIAVTQGRRYDPAKAFLERKEREGKSRLEALRCLKRHLARVVFNLLRVIEAKRRLKERSKWVSNSQPLPAVA